MNKGSLRTISVCLAVLGWSSFSMAAGGRVTNPQGRPIVGAMVNVHLQEVNKYQITTDSAGRFALPDEDFQDAFIQIKAPDGKDYATVNLPAALFATGDLAVVLQAK